MNKTSNEATVWGDCGVRDTPPHRRCDGGRLIVRDESSSGLRAPDSSCVASMPRRWHLIVSPFFTAVNRDEVTRTKNRQIVAGTESWKKNEKRERETESDEETRVSSIPTESRRRKREGESDDEKRAGCETPQRRRKEVLPTLRKIYAVTPHYHNGSSLRFLFRPLVFPLFSLPLFLSCHEFNLFHILFVIISVYRDRADYDAVALSFRRDVVNPAV